MMMKITFGLTFLFFIVSVSGRHTLQHERNEECARVRGTGRTHAVVPDSGCHRFISCYDGLAFPSQDCPITTLFNEETERCEYKENVTCKYPLADGVCIPKVLKGNCNNYTVCSNGLKLPMNCGERLVYSLVRHTCVYLEDLVGEERSWCWPNVDLSSNLNNLPKGSGNQNNRPLTSTNQNNPSVDTANQNNPSVGTANQNNPSIATSDQNSPAMGTADQKNPSTVKGNQKTTSDLSSILNGQPKPQSNQNSQSPMTSNNQNSRQPMASDNQKSQAMPATNQNNQPIVTTNQNNPSMNTAIQNELPMAPANFNP